VEVQKTRKGNRHPTEEITEPQLQTLGEIRAFISRYGFPPTMEELGDILGISAASAHGQVNHLVRKGYLRRISRKARGLMVVRRPEDEAVELTPVPIVGTVAAGLPIFAEENIVGEVLVEGKIAQTGKCFALAVSGDSMMDANIQDGDLVIVRQQPVAESGDIIVALFGDEATVKRLYIREQHIELRPENPRYKSIPIGPEDELRILGKVVATRRSSSGGG